MSDKKNLKTAGCNNPVFENNNNREACPLRRSYEKRLIAGLTSAVSLFLLALCGISTQPLKSY